jgi:hypothetical protein
MPRLSRPSLVIIVRAIEICDRRLQQFFHLHVIKAVHPHGIESPSERRILTPRKRPYPAMLAKQVVNFVRPILDQSALPREQSKRLRLHNRSPHPCLRANLAITFKRACLQIDICLKSHRPAVAASFVRPFHFSNADFPVGAV